MSSKLTSDRFENNNQTDANLFSQLQNGQTDLLATLYDRHAGLVYGIALKLLGNTCICFPKYLAGVRQLT